MQICNHKVVSLQFTMSDDAGEVIDSSDDGGALVYLHGEENIVPGLEIELEGKRVGDKLKVSLEAADAFGEIDPSLVEIVAAETFEGVDDLAIGMEFEAEMPDEGELQYVRITDIDGENVTVDGNHPLAGQHINYDVTVEAIRDATEEELEHGHVHGGDACCGEENCCN